MRQIITTHELAELTFAKQHNDISDDIINWFYNNAAVTYESLHIKEIKHEYDDLTIYSTAYINFNSYAEAIDTIEPIVAQWIDDNKSQYSLEYSKLCGTGVLPATCKDTIALAFNSNVDISVNTLKRIVFDLSIKKDITKKSIAFKHELDAAIQEYSQEHKNDDIVEHRQEYDGDDVFFGQLDYLHEFYDATHKIFDFENFCYTVGYLSEQPTISEPFIKGSNCIALMQLKFDFSNIIDSGYTSIEDLLKIVYDEVYLVNNHPTYDFIQPHFSYKELLEAYKAIDFIHFYDKNKPGNFKNHVNVGDVCKSRGKDNIEHIWILNEKKSLEFFTKRLYDDQYFALPSIFKLEKLIRLKNINGNINNEINVFYKMYRSDSKNSNQENEREASEAKDKEDTFKTFFQKYNSYTLPHQIRKDTIYDVIILCELLYTKLYYDPNATITIANYKKYTHQNFLSTYQSLQSISTIIKELFRPALRIAYINKFISENDLGELEKIYTAFYKEL